MKAKRILCTLLSICLLGCLMPATSSALKVSSIYGDCVECYELGKSFAYSVFINDNSGLCGFEITLDYDTSVFQIEPEQCKRGEFSSSGNIVCSQTATGCRVVWSDVRNASSNGCLFTISLLPRTDAVNGEYEVVVNYVAKNTIDEDNNKVSLVCQNGKIVLREPAPKFAGSTAEITPGEEFAFQVTVSENVGIAGYRIFLNYDKSVFEVEKENDNIAVNQSDAFSAGIISYAETATGCQVLWMSASNIKEDGLLFEIIFKIAENAVAGEYDILISYSAADTLNENGAAVAFSTEKGLITCSASSYTITGTALSWNDTDDAAYLLYGGATTDSTIMSDWAAGSYHASYTAIKSGVIAAVVEGKTMQTQAFTFEGVADGTYKLAVFKPGKYVPKVVEFTVNGSSVAMGQQKLWLYGDVTYDGKVNGTDAQQIQRYFGGLTSRFGTGTAEDEADRLLAANVTYVRSGDAVINGTDAQQIQRYFAGMTSVFDLMT